MLKLSETQKALLNHLLQFSDEGDFIHSWMKTNTIASLASKGAITSIGKGYIQITPLGESLLTLQNKDYRLSLKAFAKQRKQISKRSYK